MSVRETDPIYSVQVDINVAPVQDEKGSTERMDAPDSLALGREIYEVERIRTRSTR